ncbi:hypothetical protein ABZV65_19290 [Streptomyces bauhiniae]|uniref:hypothetical protein n=1 Tax=Streptomyces bauhiniae TaxID=2340725 RepID=UPI0033A78197
MTAPDQYGQNVSIWQMSDPPNLPAAVKALADGVIPRGVMRFASASARGATLINTAAPVEGMLSWLQDVNRLEVYDGSDWVSIAAGTTGWISVPVNPADGWGTWADDSRSNNQGIFQYRVVYMFGQPTIMFRGGIGRSNSSTYTAPSSGFYQLTSMPLLPDARPSQVRTLVVPCSDVRSDRITLKLDVRADGHLRLYGIITGSTPPWVGFNGVMTAL